MYPEFPYLGRDDTLLFVETYETNHSIEDHKHQFYEFLLITQGSCVHRYKQTTTTLIPGDVLLIAPGEEHGYVINADVMIYNCQFFADKMGDHWKDLIGIISFDAMEFFKNSTRKRNLAALALKAGNKDIKVHDADLNHQGIIHLGSRDMANVVSILKTIVREQEGRNIGFEYINQAYLTTILIILKRVQTQQCASLEKHNSKKREMIQETLAFLEENIDESIDFNIIAKGLHITPNYFRSIFKDVTGLSPVDYLNRIRIVKSLEYLQMGELSVSEAAAKVGIYDANYFSRLFKKVMGYSPRYFKRIYE